MNVNDRNCARNRAARCAAGVGILTVVSGLLTFAASAEPPWQSPQSIRDVASELVLRTLGADSGATVEAVGVDDRLKLPACAHAIEARLERPLRGGQGVVTVRCTAGEAWRLFVPVRAVEQVTVLVTTRAVQAGEVLAAGDVAQSRRASSTLPYEYVTAPEHAVGLAVRRTVPAGAVLVPGALNRPELIERGALVTLVSGSGSVVVRSEGIALEPARLNERVRVRSQSGRIVEGVVEASGEIRVGS